MNKKNNKKELIIIADSDPRTKPIGGIAIYSSKLAEELTKTKKYEVKFIGKKTSNINNNKKRREKKEYEIIISNKKEGKNNATFIISLFKTAHKIKTTKETIIHSQRPDWIIPFRNKKGKKIITMHGSHKKNLRAKKGIIISKIYEIIEKLAFHTADKIIFVDHETRKEYKKILRKNNKKTTIIPVGINTKEFKPEKKEEAIKKIIKKDKKLRQLLSENKNNYKKIFIYIGRLSKEKRIREMIRTIEKDELLIIIGSGEEEKKLQEQIIREQKTRNAILLGPRKQEELKNYYNIADATLIFSTHEGLPITALESMSCGTPIIATPVGELPLIINEKTGVLVRNNNYREAINEFNKKTKKQITKMKKNCREKAIEYDWKKIITRLEEEAYQ